jgi:hypothetical protein
LWDWGRYWTLGLYTGPSVKTLVLDVDDPAKFRKFVDKGNKPLLYDRWASLSGVLVAFHGDATADGVRTGTARGKLIFRLEAGTDHPICQAKARWLKSRGIEVFYGSGLPSVRGRYDDTGGGDEYELDGSLGNAPEWLIKALSPRVKTQKGKSPPISHESKAAILEDLPAALTELDPELGEAAVGWRKKDLHDGREIWVGRCPFASEHDSGESEDADLSAGVHDDGPYIKCFHSSCRRVQEVNRMLREQYRQAQAATAAGAAMAAAANPVQIGDVIEWTPDGADQLPQQSPVRDVSPDGLLCFVEGSNTGLAVEQVTILQGAKDVPEQQPATNDPSTAGGPPPSTTGGPPPSTTGGPPPSTNGPPPSTSTSSRPQSKPSRLLLTMPKDIRDEAEAMLNNPDLLNLVAEDIATIGVAGEKHLVVSVYLTGTSRLLDRPLSAIVQGPSCSGKSFTVEQVGGLFPPEAIIYATQMTPQALFHMPPGSLKHCFIVAGERSRVEDPEQAEATPALREMISSGRLSKLMPVRTKGGIETKLITQDGPIAFIETTTLSRIFDEDANRCILLHTDEQSQQTRKVLERISLDCETGKDAAKIKRVVMVHHAVQRTLIQLPVRIPYAGKIQARFPIERIEARRAFPHFLRMIQASALLHQKQRTIGSGGAILAEQKDYEVARRLLQESMSRALGDVVSASAWRFYQRASSWKKDIDWDPDLFTVKQARASANNEYARSTISGWLHELEDVGFADEAVPGRGSSPSIWKINAGKTQGGRVLPEPKDIFPP